MKLTVQGREAYAYTGGKPFDAGKPCVVLIHGALNDHSVWALQSRYLAHHGWSVLAVDLPGHGRSAGPALPDVESLGAWIVGLLDGVGARQVALAGHSMGSLIALEAAAALGDRATHLMLVATAYPMKVSAALLDTARDTPLKAIDMVNAFSHSTLAAKPAAPGPGAWLHGAGRALMRRLQAAYAAREHGANLFLHDFTVCDRYAAAAQAAERVRCSVQLLLGDKDQMTSPKATAELVRLLRAEVRRLPAGHNLMAEAPDGVLNALKAFLSSTPKEVAA
jgi:pimeloyl-ACP methyl ester carboxylesterase